MKAVVELENGKTVEFRHIQGIDDSDTALLLFSNRYLTGNHTTQMENELSSRIGRRCIILPPFITNVMGVTSGPEQ